MIGALSVASFCVALAGRGCLGRHLASGQDLAGAGFNDRDGLTSIAEVRGAHRAGHEEAVETVMHPNAVGDTAWAR